MTTQDLAYHIKEMRDMQQAYFDSRKGRYADKKLLTIAKAKEKEVDQMIEIILAGDISTQESDGPCILTIHLDKNGAAKMHLAYPPGAIAASYTGIMGQLTDMVEKKISDMAKDAGITDQKQFGQFIHTVKFEQVV